MAVKIHPMVDNGVPKGADNFSGGTLVCHCTDKPVTVEISANVLHNHACACTKCERRFASLVQKRRSSLWPTISKGILNYEGTILN